MLKLLVAGLLGVLLSVGTSLALVSSQAPEDVADDPAILTTYGER